MDDRDKNNRLHYELERYIEKNNIVDVKKLGPEAEDAIRDRIISNELNDIRIYIRHTNQEKFFWDDEVFESDSIQWMKFLVKKMIKQNETLKKNSNHEQIEKFTKDLEEEFKKYFMNKDAALENMNNQVDTVIDSSINIKNCIENMTKRMKQVQSYYQIRFPKNKTNEFLKKCENAKFETMPGTKANYGLFLRWTDDQGLSMIQSSCVDCPIQQITEAQSLEKDGFVLQELHGDNPELQKETMNVLTRGICEWRSENWKDTAMESIINFTLSYLQKMDKYKGKNIDLVPIQKVQWRRPDIGSARYASVLHSDFPNFENWTNPVEELEKSGYVLSHDSKQKLKKGIPLDMVNVWGPLNKEGVYQNTLAFLSQNAKNIVEDKLVPDPKGAGGFVANEKISKEELKNLCKQPMFVKSGMKMGEIFIFVTSGPKQAFHASVSIYGGGLGNRQSFEYRFIVLELLSLIN
jgi:hypothetical protein